MTEVKKEALEENFEALLEEFEKETQNFEEGSLVKGVIIEIGSKYITVDIGIKSVGYVPVNEFRKDGDIKVGDVVDLLLERIENKRGDLIVSRENAVRYINWHYLKDCLENKNIVDGKILGKVKGGFAVEIGNIVAFLPRSQVDSMALSGLEDYIGKMEKFMVLKIDDVRGNVVVSRRAILEEERAKEKEEILAKMQVGDVLEGVVKNLTDYGAFIDFGSFDGLLHLTDISWCRVRHPSDVLKVGQQVKVQVIKFDPKTKRVSLGMKQLQENPWEVIETKYPVGTIVKGKVTNIAQYGVFVEIDNGIEGLVHVSEMSWLKNNILPSKFLSIGQEVEVMVLDIDAGHHRISLGIKQCKKNPWQEFSEKYKVGDILEGSVKNITDFGLFVEFESGVDGLVHISDLDWNDPEGKEAVKKYKKGDSVKTILLGSSYEQERISLGIKQLELADFNDRIAKLQKGKKVPCVVRMVRKDFLEVEIDLGLKGVIKRVDLAKDKKNQKTDKFTVGDSFDATILSFDEKSGKLVLTLKSIEDVEEDSDDDFDINQYMNADTGATLGSVLGNILEEAKDRAEKNQ
jgi:small subunit ribosomal protein S1